MTPNRFEHFPRFGAKLDDSAKSSTASNGLRKEYLSFLSVTDRFDSTKLRIARFSFTSEPSKMMRSAGGKK
jgi:hypothetical protein